MPDPVRKETVVVQQPTPSSEPQKPEQNVENPNAKRKGPRRDETIEGGLYVDDPRYDDDGNLVYGRVVNAEGETIREVESDDEVQSLRHEAKGKKLKPLKSDDEQPKPQGPPPPLRK